MQGGVVRTIHVNRSEIGEKGALVFRIEGGPEGTVLASSVKIVGGMEFVHEYQTKKDQGCSRGAVFCKTDDDIYYVQ